MKQRAMDRIPERARLPFLVHAALAAALLAGPALAQDSEEPEKAKETQKQQASQPDTSKWDCRFCPEYYGWYGDLLFGLIAVSDDSLRYGSYRGLEEQGLYPALDGYLRYQDAEGLYTDIFTRDLGLESREIDARGGKQGTYEIRLGWQEIPVWRGYNASSTPFSGQGSETLTLPADWVPGRTTGEMPGLQDALSPAPLKTRRKIFDAGLTWRFSSAWKTDIDYQRQEKTGTRPFGGAGLFFNDAAILPAPVDYTTDRLDAGLSWATRTFSLRLGFLGSWFDNGRQTLTWDNPFTGTEGTRQFRAQLYPDNEYLQVSLSGAWAITRDIRLSGHAAVGEGTQNDPFLPYSINPEFADLVLPRDSLDGRVDTSVFNLGGKFYWKLARTLSLTARYKYDERDNRTPVDLWTPVISDFIIIEPRLNRPYSFERTQYSADLRWRISNPLRLSIGARQKDMTRNLQPIEDSEETTLFTELQLNAWTGGQFRLKLEGAERRVSEYMPNDARPGPVDNPLFRKYNLADRDRTRVIAEFSLATTERLGVNLSVYTAYDDYSNSPLGLQSSDLEGYTVSVDYAAGDNLTFYGYYSSDQYDSVLNGASSTSLSDRWFADTQDRFRSGGLGASYQFDNGASLGGDYLRADTKGDISVQTSLEEPPFETLRTDLRNVRLYYRQDINEKWGYRIMAEYEHFESRDWAIDNYGVDGIPSVLWLGFNAPRYYVWNIGAQATYRF